MILFFAYPTLNPGDAPLSSFTVLEPISKPGLHKKKHFEFLTIVMNEAVFQTPVQNLHTTIICIAIYYYFVLENLLISTP